jgi:hypothetical protein
VSEVENCLSRLLAELEKPEFDPVRIERDLCELGSSIVALSKSTPLAEIERVLALHAALRAIVEERRAETGRRIDAVVRARASISRLTRPGDRFAALDVEA